MRLTALVCLALSLCCQHAWAQLSARDGYAPDGSFSLKVELTPYIWLPATSTRFSLGPNGGISGSGGAGVPSAAKISDSLHGAFMGYGLVRYGPWSGEMDIDWVSASQGTTSPSGPLGNALHLSASVNVVRVAPGFGYQIVSSEIAGMPITVDARAGFAWFHWSATIGSLESPLGGLSGSDSFVQPWLGARASLYPSPNWRIELGALAQGFGVAGGSWGWGTSLLASYSVTSWMDITGGFRALSTSRVANNTGPFGNGQRSLNVVAYGPIVGVGFRF